VPSRPAGAGTGAWQPPAPVETHLRAAASANRKRGSEGQGPWDRPAQRPTTTGGAGPGGATTPGSGAAPLAVHAARAGSGTGAPVGDALVLEEGGGCVCPCSCGLGDAACECECSCGGGVLVEWEEPPRSAAPLLAPPGGPGGRPTWVPLPVEHGMAGAHAATPVPVVASARPGSSFVHAHMTSARPRPRGRHSLGPGQPAGYTTSGGSSGGSGAAVGPATPASGGGGPGAGCGVGPATAAGDPALALPPGSTTASLAMTLATYDPNTAEPLPVHEAVNGRRYPCPLPTCGATFMERYGLVRHWCVEDPFFFSFFCDAFKKRKAGVAYGIVFAFVFPSPLATNSFAASGVNGGWGRWGMGGGEGGHGEKEAGGVGRGLGARFIRGPLSLPKPLPRPEVESCRCLSCSA
jgi:hypothetical protein